MTTITINRATVEQALEALLKSHTCPLLPDDCEEAITALRAALAQQAEPVAWLYPDDYAGILKHQSRAEVFQKAWCNPAVCVPLYTAPPQRKPLTDEEILEAVGWERAEMYMKLTPNFPVEEARKETLKNARAVEAKHGIKESP